MASRRKHPAGSKSRPRLRVSGAKMRHCQILIRLLTIFFLLFVLVVNFWLLDPIERWNIARNDFTPRHVNQAKCSSLLAESYQKGGEAATFKAAVMDDLGEVPKNGKPYLILHIGPSKTGTTTLQKNSVKMQDVLTLDHYVYLGRYAPIKLRQPAKIAELFTNDACLQQVKEVIKSASFSNLTPEWPGCWKNRTCIFDQEYLSRNISVIISDEQFSYERMLISICNDPMYLQTLKTALFEKWNVLVVVTYRRYAEWLLSVSKEFNQKLCHNPNRPEGQWDGSRCTSLWELVNTYRTTTTGDAISYINLDMTVPAWRRHGIPVRILNLHDERSLTTSFYCNIVPDAPHACKYGLSQLNNTVAARENVQSAMTTAYNNIVFDAAMAGLLLDAIRKNPNVTRQEFTSQLAVKGSALGMTLADFPLHCPDQSHVEELLQKSLRLERVLFGNNTDKEKLHTQELRRLWRDQRIFCSVDTQRLLRGKTSWSEVMEHMAQLAGRRSFGYIE